MKFKKYTGQTLHEALLKTKIDLGEEAIIVHTINKTDSGHSYGEVWAIPSKISEPDLLEDHSALIFNKRLKKIEEKMSYLKDSLDFISDKPYFKQEKEGQLYDYLKEQDIEDCYAKKIINFLREENQSGTVGFSEKIKDIFKDFIKVSYGIHLEKPGPKVVALIGPTGVGKTTTIAKLAADFKFSKKKKVAIFSVDNYRIGATEQLKTYGKIMKIPVECILNKEELNEKILRYKETDLILVDTTGRSQYNEKRIQAIADLFAEIENIEIHLTVAVNTRYRDLLDVVKNFKKVPYQKIIYTKVDETRVYGSLLNISAQEKVPLSYLTNGQNVPKDIVVAEKELISSMLLKNFENYLAREKKIIGGVCG